MATRATHKGSCQVCGRQQKLPSERLSLHGYTKEWGIFSGTCYGSGHPPFEVSKDLIESAIERALNESAKLSQKALALQEPATEPIATCYVYRGTDQCRAYEKSGYIWETGRVEARKPSCGLRFVVISSDGREFYIHTENYSDTDLDAATYNNRRYAKSLLAKVGHISKYIDWQRGRIKNWAPQPLRPL